MIFAFLATNEHGRALLALIRAIRECPVCVPEIYLACDTHRAELDRLYPEPCPDPNCPACALEGPDAPQIPPADPMDAAAAAAALCTDPECPGLHPGRRGPRPVHDNGDYRV